MRKRLISLMAFFGLASAGTAFGLAKAMVIAPLPPHKPIHAVCACTGHSMPQPTPEALIDSALIHADWVQASLPEITDDIALHMVGALMKGVQFWIMVPPGTVIPGRLNFDHPGLRIREGVCEPSFLVSGDYVLMQGHVWRSTADGDDLSGRLIGAWDRAERNHKPVAHCRDSPAPAESG
jgi:hypothetical protein